MEQSTMTLEVVTKINQDRDDDLLQDVGSDVMIIEGGVMGMTTKISKAKVTLQDVGAVHQEHQYQQSL
jgi:hypothetical protein